MSPASLGDRGAMPLSVSQRAITSVAVAPMRRPFAHHQIAAELRPSMISTFRFAKIASVTESYRPCVCTSPFLILKKNGSSPAGVMLDGGHRQPVTAVRSARLSPHLRTFPRAALPSHFRCVAIPDESSCSASGSTA